MYICFLLFEIVFEKLSVDDGVGVACLQGLCIQLQLRKLRHRDLSTRTIVALQRIFHNKDFLHILFKLCSFSFL